MGYDESPPDERRASRSDGEGAYEPDRRSRPTRRDDSHRRSDRRRDRSRDRSRNRKRHRRSGSPDDARWHQPTSRDRDRDKGDERRRRRSRDYDQNGVKNSHHRRARDDDHDDDREKNGKQLVKRSGPLPSQADSFAVTKGEEPAKPKEKPNYGITGALAAATNSVVQSDGSKIVLKYHEPPEARKASPKDQWKLFVFKGEDIVDTVPLSQRSCWLVGRELAVVDLPAEHPSISKQHAVIQFRHIEKRNEYGDKIGKVKPYLIDLESANGTMLNGKKVPESRYLEIKDKDMIQFGQSTREYVIMLAPKD
ncbi:SMAD/FHA domain-containing protein [Hypoxylon fuscum]|nr:SMAD/FHA domain-containing protein [Hypoxylon fuscum]